MFNFQSFSGLPGFRVGIEQEEPGFAIEPDGSPRSPFSSTSGTPTFHYGPYGNALQMSAPNAVNSAGMFDFSNIGFLPQTHRTFDRTEKLYADAGSAPLDVLGLPGLNPDLTRHTDKGSPLLRADSSALPDAATSKMFPLPNPRGNGRDLTFADHAIDSTSRKSDAAQNASGDDGLQLVRLAQAQVPQVQTQKDASPGEVVTLPDGSTIAHPESPTGKLMAPVADLSAVAAAGRRTGFVHRAMLTNFLTAPGAPAYMLANLYANVSHRGNFDYQRRGDQFLGQFTPVSNVNVGLFAQQAGLSLEETLTIAGLYARLYSSNAKPGEPYGLHPNQLKFITIGFKIGQSGVFGATATP